MSVGSMSLTRRKRITGQGHNVVKDKSKVNLIDVNFDLTSLNLMCFYTLSLNLSVKRSHLISLRNLFEIINMDIYKSDPEKMKRIRFIKKALEARLDKNLRQPDVIIKYINDGFMDDNVLDINYEDFILSTEELEFVNGTVSETLKYSFIYNDVDDFIDVLTRFKSSNYLSKGAIVKEIETMVDKIKSNFRRVATQSMTDQIFSLKDGIFQNVVTDAYDRLSSNNNRLLCGMQGMNELTYGGFESGRLYTYFACPNTGKSLLATNLLLQMKKANRYYQPKDATKRPAVVLLTMENQITETIERIFDIALTPDSELQNYSLDEVIRMLREDGELCLTDESPIDIIVKYVPNGSVDTGYFYTLAEDLEDEGVEMVALIFDYINCIRSTYKCPDMRVELGKVAEEMKTFAILKDIPVISFGQLNRDATAKTDNARLNNVQDVARVLGRAQIAESILILNVIDWGAIIDVEYDSKGDKYMSFNRFKCRGKCTPRYYICQPFTSPNHIRLDVDIDKFVPVFKETLKDDIANLGLTSSSSRMRTRAEVMQQQEENLNDESVSLPLEDKLHNRDNIYLLSQYRNQTNGSVSIVQEPTEEEEHNGSVAMIIPATIEPRVKEVAL